MTKSPLLAWSPSPTAAPRTRSWPCTRATVSVSASAPWVPARPCRKRWPPSAWKRAKKPFSFAIITADTWPKIQKALRRQMRIDVPGTGIAFIIPVSSIGGKRALQFLTEHQTFALKEESTLKDTRYELLLVIANQGHTGSIMDAARAAGAGGGTVIHAKGTGMEGAAHFMGVDLVNEKELVLIVSRTTLKNQIMQAIMQGAGPKAGAIVFSLPVTDTAGLRLLDEE